MKILIIGAKGFIGAAVTDYFRKRGNQVIEADIVHEYGNENYMQLNPNTSDFDKLFKGQSFDLCVNCSGAAVVSQSFENTLHDYVLNTVNVYRILNAIRLSNGKCLFVTLSSAAVYGEPETLPVKETQQLNPLSPYGFHKRQSEDICEYFSSLFGLNTVVLRVFSAYGPGLRKQLFWDMYQKYLKSEGQIELFGTGEETRDFIFVEDLCKAIEIVAQSDLTGFNVYNLGSGTESRVNDVASIFYNQLDYSGEIRFSRKSLPGYPSKWVADIGELERLGFANLINLEDGIAKYLEWIKSI